VINAHIEPANIAANTLTKVCFIFSNSGDERTLFIQFKITYPHEVLHISGAKKSVGSIPVTTDTPYQHFVQIKSLAPGQYDIDVKVDCLNKPRLNETVRIPVLVVSKESKEEKDTTHIVTKDSNDQIEQISITMAKLMTECFSLPELRNLCFNLLIDCEDFSPNVGKSTLVIELILYCKRRGSLLKLVELAKKERPHVEWPQL
jgi:hypothetical protein